jgi:phosphoribosylformylglycinamidine cyclo-ligase
MTYAATGVDYDAMDPFKIACQRRAALTEKNARRLGFNPISSSRGESVFLMEEATYLVDQSRGVLIGHVEEGLGTKNLVADAMYQATSKSYYDQIAQDTVAMIVNDAATGGVFPVGLAMHLAVGESSWFDDEVRATDLVNGWGDACDNARCVWSGGETPTLSGIIVPGTALLSGSAFGVVKRGHRPINQENIQHGDAIVIIESSGIHANGLSLARKIASKLPDGYLTKLSDGRTYGEALLDPTHIYVGLVEDCLDQGVDIHYAVNITGHGWRKLMRPTESFGYVIGQLPTQQPIFDFIQQHGPVDDHEAYGNLNMGAGFALYVSESQVDKVLEVGKTLGLRAFYAGHIEQSDARHVRIKPKGLAYGSNMLAVR